MTHFHADAGDGDIRRSYCQPTWEETRPAAGLVHCPSRRVPSETATLIRPYGSDSGFFAWDQVTTAVWLPKLWVCGDSLGVGKAHSLSGWPSESGFAVAPG